MAVTEEDKLPEGYTVEGGQNNGVTEEQSLPEGFTVGGAAEVKKPLSTRQKVWNEVKQEAPKVWEGANTPLVPEGKAETTGRALSESAPTLAESEHPLLTGAKKGIAGAVADTGKFVRSLTSPLGIATMGMGELAEAPGALGTAIKAGSRLAGTGFGVGGAEEAVKGGKDIAAHGATPENLERTLQGAGQAMLGGTAAVHGTDLSMKPLKEVVTAPIRETARTAQAGIDVGRKLPFGVGKFIKAAERAIPLVTQPGTPVEDIPSWQIKVPGQNLGLPKSADLQRSVSLKGGETKSAPPLRSTNQLPEIQKAQGLGQQTAPNLDLDKSQPLGKVGPAQKTAAESGEALSGAPLKNTLGEIGAPRATRSSESGEALSTVPKAKSTVMGELRPTGARPASETGEALGTIPVPEHPITPEEVEKSKAGKAEEKSKVATAADEFNKERGLSEVKPEKSKVSEHAQSVADEFEKMKHAPNNPEVKKSYDALKKDIKDQWNYATQKMGIKIEPTDKDPYGFNGDTPAEKELMDDVNNKNHIAVWRGGNPLPKDHPLAEVDPETGENYNTMLRAVHDIFGHVAQGHDFSEPGEESAWKAHMQMMSPEARPAMTTETRGQTSWFFNNKDKPGTFADQKAGLMPEWTSKPEGTPTEGTKTEATPYAGPERREVKREKPLSAVELEAAIKNRKPVQTPFDVTEGAMDTIKRDKAMPKTPAEEAAAKSELKPVQILDHIKEGKEFAVLQAENPNNGRISDEENAKRNAELKKDLVDRGYKPQEVGGNTKDVEGVTEHAFFVPDIKSKNAVELGKKYGQVGILTHEGLHDLKTGEVTPTDNKNMLMGDEARKQQYFTTVGDQDFSLPMKEAAKGTTADTVKAETGLSESEKRGLEHRIGKSAASDTSPQGLERAQRFLKVTNQQLADFANVEGPWTKPDGSKEPWTAADFKKPSGSKDLSPNKQFVFDHIQKNIPHKEFLDKTNSWGVSMSAKGPYPTATTETAKMSDAELLKLGYTKEDIANGKHLPGIGGGSAAAAPALARGIPEEVDKLLSPEERASLKSDTSRTHFVDNLRKLPAVQEFVDVALKGEGGRKWYQRSKVAFEELEKSAPRYFQEGDRQKFTDLVAATSPRQSVAMNLREALNTWTQYIDEGRPTGKALTKLLKDNLTAGKSKIPNATLALEGKDMWPDVSKSRYFKAPSFSKNLRGMLENVTNDGWMGLFSGVDEKALRNASSYHPISVATRAAADALGWEPAEAQAAIWAFTKTFTEHGETDPEIIRQYSQDFADILAHDPETQKLLERMGVKSGELQDRLKAIGEKPEVTGRTTPTTEHSVGKLTERIQGAGREVAQRKSETGNLFGGKEVGSTEFNPEELNASGESEASKEAINRSTSEKNRGVKRYRVDTRSGREFPILSIGSVDATAGPYELIVERKPDGTETTLDAGKKARPLGVIKRGG